MCRSSRVGRSGWDERVYTSRKASSRLVRPSSSHSCNRLSNGTTTTKNEHDGIIRFSSPYGLEAASLPCQWHGERRDQRSSAGDCAFLPRCTDAFLFFPARKFLERIRKKKIRMEIPRSLEEGWEKRWFVACRPAERAVGATSAALMHHDV